MRCKVCCLLYEEIISYMTKVGSNHEIFNE